VILLFDLRLSGSNRRFKFDKRGRLFFRSHNQTLSVAALCVHNPDRSPVRIYRCDAAPTPSGFAQIVSDDFPTLRWALPI
jgi:hypothetical protein